MNTEHFHDQPRETKNEKKPKKYKKNDDIFSLILYGEYSYESPPEPIPAADFIGNVEESQWRGGFGI